MVVHGQWCRRLVLTGLATAAALSYRVSGFQILTKFLRWKWLISAAGLATF